MAHGQGARARYDELMLRGSTSSRASTASGTSLGRIASQLSKFLLGMEENGDCDLLAMKQQRSDGKVSVRRVFIMDDHGELMPGLLNIVKGVGCSDLFGLKMNRSRSSCVRAGPLLIAVHGVQRTELLRVSGAGPGLPGAARLLGHVMASSIPGRP
jgi:hypothetical protein